jgi:hypothetical protein
MTRLRVEGLLAAFPKLIGHALQQNHTFVETDTVRYVYQPLENQLFLLLITTKTSNIVEDLSTLRLLAKLIPDVAGSIQEGIINDHAFELIFAFDEVLTSGGYREDITLSTIRTNLLMDSYEEKMHLMIKQSKMDAAKAEREKKEKEIKARQMAELKSKILDGSGSIFQQQQQQQQQQLSVMAGFGGGGYQQGAASMDFSGFGGGGAATTINQGYGNQYQQPTKAALEPEPPRVVAKGMKLGGAGGAGKLKKDSLMAAMAEEDNLRPLVSSTKKTGGAAMDLMAGFGAASANAATPAIPSAPVSVLLEEKISVQMNREGGVESCDVKGTLTVTANTEQGSMVVVTINKAAIGARCTTGWSFATHPKVAKPLYEKEGKLGLKDSDKGFPLNRPVGVLRWSYSSADAVPITVNCWPEDMGDGTFTVNVEYELLRSDMTLTDVNILIPLGTTDPPVIEAISGVYKHDPRSGVLCWHQDQIQNSNSSGSLEFSIAGSNSDAFFPVQIMFSSENLLCPIEVTALTSLTTGAQVPKTMKKMVTPDKYLCA